MWRYRSVSRGILETAMMKREKQEKILKKALDGHHIQREILARLIEKQKLLVRVI